RPARRGAGPLQLLTVSTAARLSRVLLLEQAHQAADPAQDNGTGGVRLEGPGPAGMSEPGGVLAEDPADGRAGTLQEDQHQVTVPGLAGGVYDQLVLGLDDGGVLAPLLLHRERLRGGRWFHHQPAGAGRRLVPIEGKLTHPVKGQLVT